MIIDETIVRWVSKGKAILAASGKDQVPTVAHAALAGAAELSQQLDSLEKRVAEMEKAHG